jgi:nucleotide-binding universal stress UspA family protein
MEAARGKVVVGVDGSDNSVEALRLAVRLAPALDAPVLAVFCWDVPNIFAAYAGQDFGRFEQAVRERLAETLEKAFGEVSATVGAAVVRGHASAEMIEAGAYARMLVVHEGTS